MRILIANDGLHAHAYERSAWLNAFLTSGIEAAMYNCKIDRAFDVFDSFEPDIFIGQLYNLDSSTVKCIIERPHLKVALRAGEFNQEEKNEHILHTTNSELAILRHLLDNCQKPDFIFTHYFQYDIEETHSGFSEMGVKLVGIPMSADVNSYLNSSFDPDLECDIGFVGGYWPYKGQVIDKYLTPLLKDYNYKVKIFGNQLWPHVNQYCGVLSDDRVKDLFVSAKVCPNLSEPHSRILGVDVNERAFKIMCAGGFCIMDNVSTAKHEFKDNLLFFDTPEEFEDLINTFIDNKNEKSRKNLIDKGRNFVLKNHTNYHRAALFLDSFGYENEAKRCLNTLNDILGNHHVKNNNF